MRPASILARVGREVHGRLLPMLWKKEFLLLLSNVCI